MASRLDKLYELLESNNQSIRSAAALQIGRISTNSQVRIQSLLNKLLPFVKHKTWSVRIAAAEAVKHIGSNTKPWVPNVSSSCVTKKENVPEMICLNKLNLLEILKIGTRLYSTDIKELDETNADSSINRDEISRHLGFIIPGEYEIKNILNNEDYEFYKSRDNGNTISVEQAVESSMSKLGSKRSHDEGESDAGEPIAKICRVKKEEEIVEHNDENEWPWSEFCDELLSSLWNAKWEIRHGAATALRELVRSQGSVMVCKNTRNMSRSEFSVRHVRYQEEVTGRLLCTLALDQLSDFVSDEMVAPVRESCAQVLGIMSVHLSSVSLVESLARHLLSLLQYGGEWTVNHGALLGLKYLLAARLDLADTLLPIVYGPISGHLKENCDDDVRCAAAAALMPIFTRSGPVSITVDQLEALRSDLWAVLALRPDYSSPGATCAVLALLDRLYRSDDGNCDIDGDCDSKRQAQLDVEGSIGRLHCCYYSYSESVRLGAVKTCRSLLQFHKTRLTHLSHQTVLQITSQLLQRVLLDEATSVVKEAQDLWKWLLDHMTSEQLADSCLERLDVWMCCVMQPSRLSYAQGSILMPSVLVTTHTTLTSVVGHDDNQGDNDDCKQQFPKEFYIAGRESFLAEGGSATREEAVLRARLTACRLLAGLCRHLATIPVVAEHILVTILSRIHLKERLAIQRFVAGSILAHWSPAADWAVAEAAMLAPVRMQLLAAIEDPIYYQELLPAFRQMIRACRDLVTIYEERGIAVAVLTGTSSLNLAQCQSLVTEDLLVKLAQLDSTNGDTEASFAIARTAVELCSLQHASLTRLVEVALGRALLHWKWLPTMLTPLIKPLMDTVRTDQSLSLQHEASLALAQLVVDHADSPRLTGPIGKLVRNLVQYLSDSIDAASPYVVHLGDRDVVALHKVAALGREAYPGQEEVPAMSSLSSDDATSVKMRGARNALVQISARLVATDPHGMLPQSSVLHQLILRDVMHALPLATSNVPSLLASLRAMVTCLPSLMALSATAIPSLVTYAHCLLDYGLGHRSVLVRHWTARVLAVLVMPASEDCCNLELSRLLLDTVLLGPVMRVLDCTSTGTTSDHLTLGSIELLYLVMHRGLLHFRLALLVTVLPVVLRCLNAPLEPVRQVATHIFSILLSLLPLEQSGADLSILTENRRLDRQSHLAFIDGLLKPQSIADGHYAHHDKAITSQLRHYQSQGVNWLSFLNRYGLHGVLADDMGLGKTLQTICIMVGEHCRSSGTCGPSLVVCPPTLTSHWHQEISRHVACSSSSVPQFSSIIYTGSVDVRHSLLPTLHRYQLVITSYDILRNDIDKLTRPVTATGMPAGDQYWNYFVLDEGHLIRNHKSKIAIATKSVCARHRLVLTGTPIQNRVAELWSLFDFLMPGLLGTHADFHRRYGRLLDQSGSGSGSSKKMGCTETGTVVLDELHRQVLPFMLRRVKEDVLDELPAKIMQDYVCTMTSLQARLYSYCIDSHSQSLDDGQLDTDGNVEQRKHVFQAMHYLRLVCNHPSLALCASHPLYESVMHELAASRHSLDDIRLSGKLVALKQLIIDCGVGANGDDMAGTTATATANTTIGAGPDAAMVVSSHRLLVFCQSRSMITLVEHMITKEIPRASHLRLDGSVPAKDRQSIVDRFNQDASIDLLLLTTSIGGLGLNLTSADIVIFVEHDWNPMRDLQAMDRAHRIGQKNTVNVYRLITADSIEEKIMNLQKFKLFIANSVVSTDNKQMASMNTDSLLDIMNKDKAAASSSTSTASSSTSSSVTSSLPHNARSSLLSRLDGVHDSLDEYDHEYNLDSFVQKL